MKGREIWLAEVTDRNIGPASEKPAFWVDGNTRTGEVTGSMAALFLIHTLLEAECEKLTRFALSHASAAPLLKAELSSENLSDGLRRIELVVENTGYFPTNITKVAADKKLTKPVAVEIRLPEGASLVSGEREKEIGHLAGRSALEGNSWKGPAFFVGLPSDYARRIEWVVRGEGMVGVEVRSEKAGRIILDV